MIDALQAGTAGAWTLVTVLSRTVKRVGQRETTTDPEAFFSQPVDLLIDLASPKVLQLYGERMLASTQCWTVNGAALADESLYHHLASVGREHGHRLRVLSGAIAGLDGVAAATVDEQAKVSVSIDLAPSQAPRELVFEGAAKQAAEQFPEHVNVGLAAALAGKGTRETQVEVVRPNVAEGRKLRLSIRSAHGTFETVSTPSVVPGQIHTVASSVIAALRQSDKTIWVG